MAKDPKLKTSLVIITVPVDHYGRKPSAKKVKCSLLEDGLLISPIYAAMHPQEPNYVHADSAPQTRGFRVEVR